MTFAQHDEDDVLLRFFDGFVGAFVEVGALDGFTYSNTLLLEQRGWRGLLVEPNPQMARRLAANRPLAHIVMAACVAPQHPPMATLYLSAMPELATLNPSAEGTIERIHASIGASYAGLQPVTVPAFPLDVLLEAAGIAPDLVSIDTEWTNADALAGFSLHRWRPRLVVIEEGDGVREGMAGYHFARQIASNLFYTRDAEDVAWLNAV